MREPRAKSRRILLLGGTALLAGYGFFLVRNASFSVGGSDSSGYLNTARRLVNGTLVGRPRALDRFSLPDEFRDTFIPLGFVTGPTPGTFAPFYPSGLPGHMAVAGLLLGWDRGPFLVAPLTAVFSLLLLYLLGRELSLSPGWAAGAAAVFGAWSVFIGQAVQPMSDVPATLWALAAILCALKARTRRSWALAAGAAVGIAFLVRPTNLLIVAPLALALPLTLPALGLFILGGVPFAAFLAIYNLHCFGSVRETGYSKAGLQAAIAFKNFPPRFVHYGSWILKSLTPLVPAAWLGVAFDRNVARRDRALLLVWFGTFFLFYCLYEPYDSFWFIRFLLPGAPALILGATFFIRDFSGRLGRARIAIATSLGLLLVVLFWEARSVRETHVLETAEGESIYPQICAWAARTLPPRAVVFSMAASGALENYTNLSYARWDWIEKERFPDLRERVESKGGLWFALLFPFEAKQFPERIPGRWKKLGALRDVELWELER